MGNLSMPNWPSTANHTNATHPDPSSCGGAIIIPWI